MVRLQLRLFAKTNLPVELVNHLSHGVTIPAKALICDLHSTEDVDLIETNEGGEASCHVTSEADANFLKKILHMNEQLTADRVEEM